MRERRESVGPVATITLCLGILAILIGAAAGWLVAGAIVAAPVVASACAVAIVAATIHLLRRSRVLDVRVRLPGWLDRAERASRSEPRLGAGVQRAIALGAEEARHFRRPQIGTEHLLLGLMRADGHASRALASCGVTLESLIRAVDAVVGPGADGEDASPPLAPAARRVVEAATDHARDVNARVVTSGHLLVALAAGAHGTAAAVLESLGCTPAILVDALRATGRRGDD